MSPPEPNRRILIVDDNRAIHDDLKKVLGGERISADVQDDEALLFGTIPTVTADFEIDSAYQGQEAVDIVKLALAAKRPYALAFIDVRMPPGWDGVETIARLREVDPDLQTVICTAYSDYSWNEIEHRVGNSDSLLFLKKPFDNIEVVQLAHTLTRKWLAKYETESRMADLDLMVSRRTAESKALTEQYRMIVETASDAIITMTPEGEIRFANTAAAQIFGYPVTELVHREFSSLVPHFRDQAPSVQLQPKSVEITGEHRDGHALSLEVSYARSLDYTGDPIVTAVLRDVTGRKRLEISLTQAQKLESIGRLAAGVAHEINTPIQYVGDNVRFLQTAFGDLMRLVDRLPEHAGPSSSQDRDVETQLADDGVVDYLRTEVPKAIEQMLEGIDQVTRIVRAMREFSHPGLVEKIPVDVNRVIESAVLVSRNEWKDVAELTTDLAPGLSPILSIGGELNQVLVNLIVNAADAIGSLVKDSGGKGSIHISTSMADEFIEIRVSDTGCGIAENIVSKVFDPFFTTKPVGKGTGQGLAIAHSVIVQKHGGTIHLESAVGHGTTFVVQLRPAPELTTA